MSLIEKIARALMRHFDVDPDVFIATHGDRGHFDQAAQAALTAIMDAGDGVQEVQQIDREAVAWLNEEAGFTLEAERTRRGERDDRRRVQAFARHRSTAAAAERARRDAEIVERLRKRQHHPRCCAIEGRVGHCACSIDREQQKHDQRIADAIERGEV